MRILPIMPRAEGYEPQSVDLNCDEGILDITHPSDCMVVEESKIIAETLILRCFLRPLPLKNKDVKVQLFSEGIKLEEVSLYAKTSIALGYDLDATHAQWEGIALEYAGVGQGVHQGKPFTFFGKALPQGQIEGEDLIYTKPFYVEKNSHLERRTTVMSGQVLTSPPGILDASLLRGYGGYYKEGTPLEDIEQVYYSLTSSHTHTQVRLFKSSTLQEQHTPPPKGGHALNQHILFSPEPREEEYLSLPGAIAAGYAHISLSTEWGQVRFSSFLCEAIPGHPHFVNIYFQP